MADLFTSIFFRFFVVPLATVSLAVFVKTVSKNDKYSKFAKEDVAVGLQIAVGAVIAFTANAVALAQRMALIANKDSTEFIGVQQQFFQIPWIILALTFGLWAISTIVRKLGWQSDSEMTLG